MKEHDSGKDSFLGLILFKATVEKKSLQEIYADLSFDNKCKMILKRRVINEILNFNKQYLKLRL